jgi:shikimate kinase
MSSAVGVQDAPPDQCHKIHTENTTVKVSFRNSGEKSFKRLDQEVLKSWLSEDFVFVFLNTVL